MSDASISRSMSPQLLKVVERAQREPDGRFHSLAHLIDVPVSGPLTRLFNRSVGISGLDQKISRAKRTGAPLTLLMLDMDDFKTLNDTRGHVAGDQALRHTASSAPASPAAGHIDSRRGRAATIAARVCCGVSQRSHWR